MEKFAIINEDEEIRLENCDMTGCACGLVHCPFCDTDHFKPASHIKVRDHLELRHFSYAIQYRNQIVMKCFKKCGEKQPNHYHCPDCDVTFVKRGGLTSHLKSHARTMTMENSAVIVPHQKMPGKILIKRENDEKVEISLCHEACDGNVNEHFHCPDCDHTFANRSAVIQHIWRCGHDKKENISLKQHEAFSNIDLQHPKDNKDIKWHLSIVRTLKDLNIKQCEENDCCSKQYHCDLCGSERFKPLYQTAAYAHFLSHWNKRVQYKGYSVLPCFLPCEIEEGTTFEVRSHYHCPVCGQSRRRRQRFIYHLKICQGSKVDTLRYAMMRSQLLKSNQNTQGVSKKEDVLPFVGTSSLSKRQDTLETSVCTPEAMCEEIKEKSKELETPNEPSLNMMMNFDEQSYDKTVEHNGEKKGIEKEDIEESMEVLSTEDTESIPITKPEDKHKNAIPKELSSSEIFSEVTAKLSPLLVHHFGEESVISTLESIKAQTDVRFDSAPGISEKVFTVTGDINHIIQVREEICKQFEIGAYKSQNTDIKADVESMNASEENSKKETEQTSQESTMSVNPKFSRNLKKSCDKASHLSENVTPRRQSLRSIKRVDYIALQSGNKDLNQKELTARNKDNYEKMPIENTCSNFAQNSEFTNIDLHHVKNSEQSSHSVQGDEIFSLLNTSDNTALMDNELSDDNLEENEYVGDVVIPHVSFTFKTIPRKRHFKTSFSNPTGSLESDKQSNSKDESVSNTPYKSQKVAKKEKEKLNCRLCKYSGESFESVTSHMLKDHEQEAYRCDICEREFFKEFHLERHLNSKHGPLPLRNSDIFCKTCDVTFPSEKSLASHMRDVHKIVFSTPKTTDSDSMDLNVCEICGMRFSTASNLKIHKQAAHQKNEHKCHICSKIFNHSRYLKNHMKRHSSIKKYVCEICQFRFVDSASLKAHMETHKKPEDRSYSFECQYCRKKFDNKTNFNDHVNKHTGDRPHKCDECSSSFSFKTALTKHKMFVHSTEKKYQCSQCQKAFKMKHLLKSHMVTHTGTSQFVCEFCRKVLSCKNSLRVHMGRCKMNSANLGLGVTIVITPDQNFYVESGNHAENSVAVSNNSIANLQNSETLEHSVVMQTSEIGYGSSKVTSYEVLTASDGSLTDLREIRSHHPNEQSEVYVCSECGEKFSDLASAEKHILTSHGEITPMQLEEEAIQNIQMEEI